METLLEKANDTARTYAGCDICNNRCEDKCRLYRLIRLAFVEGFNSYNEFQQSIEGE